MREEREGGGERRREDRRLSLNTEGSAPICKRSIEGQLSISLPLCLLISLTAVSGIKHCTPEHSKPVSFHSYLVSLASTHRQS